MYDHPERINMLQTEMQRNILHKFQLHHLLTRKELLVPTLQQAGQKVSLWALYMYFLAANSMV
jgi:hypothetical protein